MKKAVVLVDDEAIILMAMSAEFRRLLGSAYRVETALSADEALTLIAGLQSCSVELAAVFSDWLMPGTKGTDFLAGLRKRFPNLPLVLITGQCDEALLESVVAETGIDAYLKKPWRESSLAALLRSMLIKA